LPKSGDYSVLKYASTSNDDSAELNRTTDYTAFADYEIIDQRYSTAQTVTTLPDINDKTYTGNPGNDMVVIKVNFGSNPNDNVKLKLDKLNYE
jgi:hypothetical protein